MSLYDDLGVAARCELAPVLEVFAYAMPRGAPQGAAAVHLALRAPGMVMNYNMPLEPARAAHARLGDALRTFDLAQELARDLKPAAISPESMAMLHSDTLVVASEAIDEGARQVPNPQLQALSARTIREQERLYRAKLAVRLGLAEDDIRAVFDLSAAEMALLRAEVAGA